MTDSRIHKKISVPAGRTAGKVELLEGVKCALGIAEDLGRRAIRTSDGGATWIAPKYLPQAGRFQLRPIGYSLYDGACGVALFLAALARVDGGDHFRDLALAALQPVRRALRRPEDGQEVAVRLGIGGAFGLGSLLYTFVKIGGFLHEDALVEEARLAADLITPEHIADDGLLDVVSGASGAVLGLAAVHEVHADPILLQKALLCGQRLLDTRVESAIGARAWADRDGTLLTGYSHGTAGIAYALLVLYRLTEEAEFRGAAAEAITCERSVLSRVMSDGPRSAGSKYVAPLSITTWCSGAPGITLGRLGGLDVLNTSDAHQDIETALGITLGSTLRPIDQLCCGNLGRSETLLTAALRLERPDLLTAAESQVAQVVARSRTVGGFGLHPLLPNYTHIPGFFQGTAGIGYSLLRLECPSDLPAVLLWE